MSGITGDDDEHPANRSAAIVLEKAWEGPER